MILTCRRLFAVSLIFLFLIPAAVSASQDARIFVTAVEDYHNGNYRSSQDRFNELVNRGVASAELFYNLGNCCFKQEDLGHCIWWYEKALQLNPGDPDIRFNLDYARTFVKDTSNTAPFPFYRIFFFWKELLPSSFLMVAALTLNGSS
ncbi:MAG: hypothetical protein CSA22_00890 [Deltaproteobacteria bacterium]|nr:MAG: hypothetical protein CSA22_00890 [Deltaproteobacteria bacterium]